MPRGRQRPTDERLAELYAQLGSVRAVGEALGVSHTAAAGWLKAAGVRRRGSGRPRASAGEGRVTLHVSEVDHAGLKFRAAQRGAGLQVTVAAIIGDGLAAGGEPAELAGPAARHVTVKLSAEVLEQLRAAARARGVSMSALASGLAAAAVPN